MFKRIQQGVEAFKETLREYKLLCDRLFDKYKTEYYPKYERRDKGKVLRFHERLRGMEEALGLTREEACDLAKEVGLPNYVPMGLTHNED